MLAMRKAITIGRSMSGVAIHPLFPAGETRKSQRWPVGRKLNEESGEDLAFTVHSTCGLQKAYGELGT